LTTLDENTIWKLRINLNDSLTAQGKKVDETFIIDLKFIEEQGYEPPQGRITQVTKNNPNDDEIGDIQRLKILNGNWKLSEDPQDRKDGFWIWGVFKDPLYPFLLLQLDTDMVQLPGEDGDFIAPISLHAMIYHERNKESGVVLKSPTTLTTRIYETMKADPFGGATIDLYEEAKVGQLYFM